MPMSAIRFVGTFIDEWAKSPNIQRNVLIAGDVEDRKLAQIARKVHKDKIKIISGATLQRPEDVGAIIGKVEADQLLIVSQLESISETALDNFAYLLTDRKVHFQSNDPPRIGFVDFPNFFIICIIDPSFTVSPILFEMFDCKILLGRETQISIANEETLEEGSAVIGGEIAHSHRSPIDFLIISYEMPIILRIDAYLSENPEWFHDLVYTPAENPGGTYSLLVNGGNEALAKAIYDKFRWIGQFAIENEGKLLFGGILRR